MFRHFDKSHLINSTRGTVKNRAEHKTWVSGKTMLLDDIRSFSQPPSPRSFFFFNVSSPAILVNKLKAKIPEEFL